MAEGRGVAVKKCKQYVAFFALNCASVDDGSNGPNATPTTSSPPAFETGSPPHASSSTCEFGSTPAEVRNCSNWRNLLGRSCSRNLGNQGYFRAVFRSA